MDKRRKTERKIRRGEKMRERERNEAYMAADRWEEGGNGENREEHRREKLRERGREIMSADMWEEGERKTEKGEREK